MKSYRGINLGEKVLLTSNAQGIVKYIGKVPMYKGVVIGLELNGRFGEHNGTVKGKFYFKAKPKTGVFVPRNKIKKVLKSLKDMRREKENMLLSAIRSGKFQTYRQILEQSGFQMDLHTLDKEYKILVISASGEVSSGRRMIMLDLIWKGAELDEQDIEGRSTLMVCSMRGNLELTEILAKHNACLDLVDNDGRTALMLAAVKNQFVCVNMLASNNANLNFQDKAGRTALMLAAIKGHGEVVQLLADHGAALNAQDEDGRTVLHLCALNGMTKMVELLCRNKCDLDIVDNEQTALMLCYERGDADMVELIA